MEESHKICKRDQKSRISHNSQAEKLNSRYVNLGVRMTSPCCQAHTVSQT